VRVLAQAAARRRGSRRITRTALTGAAAAVVAACGTTTPATTTVAGGGGRTAASGSSPLVGGPTAGEGTAGTGPLAGAQAAGGGATAPTSGGTTGSATGGASPATSGTLLTPRRGGPRGTAPGVTPTTIKIGIYTVQAFSKVADSIGVNVATGDQAAEAKAVISYINSHGGVAGRKLVPVIHDFDVAAASQDPNNEYQQACAEWTQDERVYALATPVGTVNDTLYSCLARAKVITSAAGDNKDRRFFEKYGDYFYEATDMNATRMLSNNVDALYATGFFGPRARIGVLRLDNHAEKAAVEDGLKPALARHGLRADDEFAFPASASSSNGTETQSAVLRFQRNGITHVLFTGGASPLTFGTAADSQKYYPRYGLNSRNSPASLLQANMSAEQLEDSMGMGWQPMNDVDTAHDPGPVSKRAELCLKLMKDSGQDTTVRATALIGLWLCDAIFFLRDALLRAPDFSAAGFRVGAEALARYEAASTFTSTYGPRLLHDGARAYRMFRFKTACRCFVYVSPLRTTKD
jgi:hypothetical protein